MSGGITLEPKIQQWMEALWIKELGWTTVEDAYVAYFESKFSEPELNELLSLARNPTLKKLLREEALAFRATQEQRATTFSKFWERYNSGEFSPGE